MNNLRPVFIREEVIKGIRVFFEKQHFHEVIPPCMNFGLPIEPNIHPFVTTWKTSSESRKMYLSTSPEIGMKKMLAKGIGNCYGIGKSFRNLEGSGSLHVPEFLMLEWYRENGDYHDIMKDTEHLIVDIKHRIDTYLKRSVSDSLEYQGKKISLKGEWPVFSLIDLFKEYAGMDFEEIIKDEVLIQKAEEKGYNVENSTWFEVFDQIFVNEIENKLPLTPFFLIDFPARTSPMCAVKKDKPYVVERFEVFMFGKELGNGNTESTDSKYVRSLFEKEQDRLKKKGLPYPPIDEQFIHALEKMSDKVYGGVGIGIDRLAMIMADVTNITQVEQFYE